MSHDACKVNSFIHESLLSMHFKALAIKSTSFAINAESAFYDFSPTLEIRIPIFCFMSFGSAILVFASTYVLYSTINEKLQFLKFVRTYVRQYIVQYTFVHC